MRGTWCAGSPEWVREIYSFVALPDFVPFLFKSNLEVSLQRILDGRPVPGISRAGMDLRLSTDPRGVSAFSGANSRALAMSNEFNFLVIDANQPVEATERGARIDHEQRGPGAVQARRELYQAAGAPAAQRPMEREATIRRPKRVVTPRIVVPKKRPRRFYGHGIPGVELQKLAGKLIVVEGADGSGRSTQIASSSIGSKRAATPRCRWG